VVFWRRQRRGRWFTASKPEFLPPDHSLVHMPAVFPLRVRPLGFRRSDVLEALEEQGRAIESLAHDVDRLWREKERAWETAHRATRSMLLEHRRSERQVREARSRAEQVEADAGRIVREAEQRAAQLTSEAADGFVEVTAKLRELVDLRDELLAAAAQPRTRRRSTSQRGNNESVPARASDPAA
jgi:hypothetical protein